tara:strand:+ start:170 stop:727 length:558 start_codon:yes stop_codon:yes gene_type:complete
MFFGILLALYRKGVLRDAPFRSSIGSLDIRLIVLAYSSYGKLHGFSSLVQASSLKDIMVSYNNNFKFDLEFGQIREQRIADMLLNHQIEVKTERGKWVQTGNIAIEVECRGKPSGLATTEATYWMHILEINGEDYCSLLFRTDVLKQAIKATTNKRIVMGGDDNLSKMVLVPITELFEIAAKSFL